MQNAFLGIYWVPISSKNIYKVVIQKIQMQYGVTTCRIFLFIQRFLFIHTRLLSGANKQNAEHARSNV